MQSLNQFSETTTCQAYSVELNRLSVANLQMGVMNNDYITYCKFWQSELHCSKPFVLSEMSL